MNARIRTQGLALLSLLAIASFGAQAKDVEPYPSKPIKLIVPTVPGPPPDVVARLLGEKLAAAFGRPLVVENRPGAIGTIGLNAVAKASADGYTLGLIALPYIVAPSLLATVPYDTERDLAPVAMINWSYTLLAVTGASNVRSVADLVAVANAKPGTLKFSSGGNGTPPHLAGELFIRAAGVQITHIPYKGSPAGVMALLAGDVDLTFGATAMVSPHLKSGKLRALATVAPRRATLHPEIPTLIELGYAGLAVSDWQGVVAPAGTPRDVIARLHAEIVKLLVTPDFRERLHALGLEPSALGPELFAAHIQNEIHRWGRLVRAAGIRAD